METTTTIIAPIPLPPIFLELREPVSGGGPTSWPLPFWVKWGLSLEEQQVVWMTRYHKKLVKLQKCHSFSNQIFCWCKQGEGHRS